MSSQTASIFCARIAENIVMDIIVRPGKETRAFKEAFPDALAHGTVHLADDPVAEVKRQIEAHKQRREAAA